MCREILFKAKKKNWRTLPKEKWWIEGDLIQNMFNGTKRMYISSEIYDKNRLRSVHKYETEWRAIEIDHDTLCQYTGLTNKSGKRIWENDIVVDEDGCYYEVLWNKNLCNYSLRCFKTEYMFLIGKRWDLYLLANTNRLKVVGNIFDNAELLEVSK